MAHYRRHVRGAATANKSIAPPGHPFIKEMFPARWIRHLPFFGLRRAELHATTADLENAESVEAEHTDGISIGVTGIGWRAHRMKVKPSAVQREEAMDEVLSLTTLAKMIDHSLLHPTLTDVAIEKGCEVAKAYGVATACVKPYAVHLAKNVLSGSAVGICAVISFPHGNSTTAIKVREAEEAVLSGAGEIDMVVNIGKALGGSWDYVSSEIRAVNDIVLEHRGILKVIFENDYLEDEHIRRLCQICAACAVMYVKTSTGYGFVKQANGMYSYAGATDHHLRLMREHTPSTMGIKAAGGVRTLDDVLRVRRLGVTRIGATATVDILEEAKRRGYQ